MVFDLKLNVGWGLQRVALDESGCRAYCVDVDWMLNFLSVVSIFSPERILENKPVFESKRKIT